MRLGVGWAFVRAAEDDLARLETGRDSELPLRCVWSLCCSVAGEPVDALGAGRDGGGEGERRWGAKAGASQWRR